MTAANDREWASHILGAAVIEVWSALPQDVQQKLFEQAVLAGQSGNEENRRERLAKFLHDHHQRTAGIRS
ncbi:MAG TPA: hypothetical protein VGJ75_20320 [Dongiaceae bacterium]